LLALRAVYGRLATRVLEMKRPGDLNEGKNDQRRRCSGGPGTTCFAEGKDSKKGEKVEEGRIGAEEVNSSPATGLGLGPGVGRKL